MRLYLGIVLEVGQSCASKTKCRMTYSTAAYRGPGEQTCAERGEWENLVHSGTRKVRVVGGGSLMWETRDQCADSLVQ